MACARERSPWGVERKSRSGYPDPTPRSHASAAQGTQGRAARVGAHASCADGGVACADRAAWITPKKRTGAGASVTPALRHRSAQSLGSPALQAAGAAPGAAPVARPRQQTGWSKPKLRSTRVRVARLTSRLVRRPERRDPTDAMQGGSTPGGSSPPHGTAPNVPGVRLSLVLRRLTTAIRMPSTRSGSRTRFELELRGPTLDHKGQKRWFGRVDSTKGPCPRRQKDHVGDAATGDERRLLVALSRPSSRSGRSRGRRLRTRSTACRAS